MGAVLEVEHLFELDAVAEIAAGKAAFMNDDATALDVGARSARQISGHAQREGDRLTDFQAQRAAQKKARPGNVAGFRGDFGFGRIRFTRMKAKRDLQQLAWTDTFLEFLHVLLLAQTERALRVI